MPVGRPLRPGAARSLAHSGHSIDFAARAVAAAVLLLCLLAAADARGAAGAPALFGSAAARAPSMTPLARWPGSLERYFAGRPLTAAPCAWRVFNACHLDHWQAFLTGLRGRGRMAQMRAVNAYMNRAPFLADALARDGARTGADDPARPTRLGQGPGRVGGPAIAKYLSLRALGFRAADLRVVMLRADGRAPGHAILVATLRGRAYVLDNRIRTVVEAWRIGHYRPLYSVNEHASWVHH